MISTPTHKKTARDVILVTTAMLSFISFWRAAAIVLCDIASTVYYIGGIAERAIGKAAPWFILAVMLFSYAVRSVYIESCGMFVRGGVYRVVKEAMGGTLAKLSVSALMFDYVLTGPISAVSAGQYMTGLINSLLPHFGLSWQVSAAGGSMALASVITLYFWWQNVKGIPESSDKALKIMGCTTVMALIIIVWSVATLWVKGVHWPPFAPVFNKESLGWLFSFKDSIRPLGVLGLTIAFGHSLLAMSGEETLAQVYREIEAPKLRNLKKAAFIVFLYSMLLTCLGSFFAIMIIPDAVRMSQYSDNLLSGLTMYLIGPEPAKLFFQGFVVFTGFLILSGAVNTSIIGSNGVLNRLGEDGILPEFLRKPHRRFGTSSRLIDLTVVLQLLTIVLCRGDIYVLGEAYAFGVIWSFVFKVMAVLMLRYKDKTRREWRVPLNLRIKGVEIPLGLIGIFFILLATACVNLVTKQVATVSGVIFTAVFFAVFVISERVHAGKGGGRSQTGGGHVDRVNLTHLEVLDPKLCGCSKPRRVIVAVRDANNLAHLGKALSETDEEMTDMVVMTSKIATGLHLEGDLGETTKEEELLFTKIIAEAEKIGHPVIPLYVPSNDPFYAMARVAFDLDAEELVVGKSGKFAPEIQMEHIALAWGSVRAKSGKFLKIRIIWENGELKEEL